MVEFGIYKWTNLVTEMVLVGQTGSTQGFAIRLKHYLYHLNKGIYGSPRFQNSWTHHGGEKAFKFEVIEVHTDDSRLTEREQFWVDHYRLLPAGVYNAVGPVDAPRRGATNTPEHNAKISVGNKGKPRRKGWKAKKRTAEQRAAQSARMKGQKRRPMSEAAKAKSSATQKGREFTEQHLSNLKRAIRESPLVKEGYKKAAETQRGVPKETLRRPVERVDLKTGEVKEYTGVNATAVDGFDPSHVSAVCKGKRPTHLGFGWHHLDRSAQ